MKNKAFFWFVFFIVIINTKAQTYINSYQYWFDNDFSNAIKSPVTPLDQDFILNENIDGTALQNGMHVLNIRFKDDGGLWSAIASQYFYKLPIHATANKLITGYQYWFDNDYTNAIETQAETPLQEYVLLKDLDATVLQNGMHVLNIRFKDDGGLWSNITTQYFLKLPIHANSDKKITEYQYWFDNDFLNADGETLNNEQNLVLIKSIDANALSNGMHTFNIRFKDDGGQWSSFISKTFLKASADVANNQVIAYRYWLDEDFTNAKYIDIDTPATLINLDESLDFSNISIGDYTFNIQFKDTFGKWSAIVSSDFSLNALNVLENDFKNSIAYYPNPTKGMLNINLGVNYDKVTIQIFNVNGQLIKKEILLNMQKTILHLDYDAGFYFITIKAEEKNATLKVLKQ
ncbi:T9SS type A sorting domain-containing protein [Mariniflexile sp.]|uniref:T9SS type A sorting domain-containing protein n=1 Tax=Mariniflexile sp. TaxID=1979402 RepID=UPI003568FCA3